MHPIGNRIFKVFAMVVIALAGISVTVQAASHEEASNDLDGKHVAFLVCEGFHDGETYMPMAYLVNRGAKVTVIGIEPGEVTAYNSDITAVVQKSVTDVSVDDFDAIVIPGGESPANLRENEDVVDFTREFFESGKPTAAICHGPQVLITAGVLEGRQATGFGEISDELEDAGVNYQDVEVLEDDNLITSRNPDDIAIFSETIAEALME